MVPNSVKLMGFFLVFCSKGLFLEIAGPTMIDMRMLFNATYEDVSRSVSGRGAGAFVGAAIGGILCDGFPHLLNLFVCVSECIAALTVFLVPFSFSINTVMVHFFILGVCSGIINIAGIRTIVSTWAEKSATALQFVHIGYGTGALLLPICVNPFLAVIRYHHTGNETNRMHDYDYDIIKSTRVHLVFIGVGFYTMCLSILFGYFHVQSKKSPTFKDKMSPIGNGLSLPKKLSFVDRINPATYANGNFAYGTFVILVLCFYFFNAVGGPSAFSHFVRSLAVDAFRFTDTQASYLNTTYWINITVGRAFWVIVSSRMRIRRLILLQVILHAISVTCINLYASTSPVLLWVCTAVEGFLASPLYPCAVAFGNSLIELSGLCLMLIHFACSSGDLCFLWLVGSLYDHIGPMSVIYTLQCVGLVLLICIVMLRLGAKYSKTGRGGERPRMEC